MKISISIGLLSCLLASVFSGCAHEPAAIVPPELESASEEVAEQEAAATNAAQDVAQEDSTESSLGDAVAGLLQKAKATAPTLDGTKKWFSDTGEATGQTADDTLKWVNDTYKSLSDRGLTTAKDAGDWVSEDWNSIGAWEYKVVLLENKTEKKDRVSPEQTLNEHGKLRWECFHVSDGPSGVTFFMKRQKKSYLKNMPLRDVLKLVPLLGADGGGEGQ